MAGRAGVREAVRTYKRRGSRVTPGQADARARLWEAYGLTVECEELDLSSLFGRQAPVVLEIGFGMGETTAAMAEAQPDHDLLAVDVHTPGIGALLRLIEQRGLPNVRVADGDAVTLLVEMLQPASLHEVRVFFPDPWPKRRHWKRRLVGEAFADFVAMRLVPGGVLHVATDWEPYAEQVRRVLTDHPEFELTDRVPWRPRTRFEETGLAAGRSSYDVVGTRVAS